MYGEKKPTNKGKYKEKTRRTKVMIIKRNGKEANKHYVVTCF